MTPALELAGVSIRFGGVQALAEVSLRVAGGEFVGLIGPNGAGKTTLLRIIAGIMRPDAGRVTLAGSDITALPTALRVRKGLALTHQVVRPFRRMTAVENVILAAGHRRTGNPLRALVELRRKPERLRAIELLARVGLFGTERRLAAELPLGQLKRLEIARALALEPRVMLLDEPLAGLNHAEAARQIDTIAGLNAAGMTIVLVEHNLEEVLRICPRLVVLNNGRVIADGKPSEVMAHAAVRGAYIGDDATSHAPAR
jgi:branched-chain amino acid transport system ATP-binding protein